MPEVMVKHALNVKNHVKFLTKRMKFTKLNILDMVEIHVNHGFQHVPKIQKSCYISGLVQGMNCSI